MGFRRAFTVKGLNLERFVQQATANGLKLYDLRRTKARMLEGIAEEKSVAAMVTLAERGGWQFKGGKRVGQARVAEKLALRWFLIFGACVAVIACFFAVRFVWQIRIIDAGPYEADIRAALDEMNIRVPAWRADIDPGAIRDALEWRYPRIAWFECGWRGMTLEVRPVQGIEGRMTGQESGPCDVVAVRDGVVDHIVTKAGTPLVGPGDLVQAGQVLIRGEERTSDGAVRPVAARGNVFARVWISAEVRTPLTEVETIYSGRTQEQLNILSPWFPLWKTEDSPFERYDTSVREIPLGGIFIPLTIRHETRMEADFRSEMRDFQSVVDDNGRIAEQKLVQIAGGKESLVDNWVNWSIIEDEILLSVATGEILVDIAQQERSSGMAATE